MSQHTAGPERPLPPPATTKPATRSYSRSTGAGRVIPPFFRGVRAAAHAPAPAPEAAGYVDTAAAGAAPPVEMPEAHPPAAPVEWYVTESAPPEEAAAAAALEFEAPAAEAHNAAAHGEAPAAEAQAAEAQAAEAPAAEEPEFLVDADATADSWTAEAEPTEVWSDTVESPDQEASGGEWEPAPDGEGWFGWGDPATGRGVPDDEPTGFEPPPPYDEPADHEPPQSFDEPAAVAHDDLETTARTEEYAAPEEYAVPEEYTAPEEYVAPEEYTAPEEYAAADAYEPTVDGGLDDSAGPADTASWEAPRTDHPGPGAESAAPEAGTGYPLDAFLVSSDSTITASPAGEGRDLAERVAVQLEELARDLRDNGMPALASRSTSGELARLLAAVVAGFYARDH